MGKKGKDKKDRPSTPPSGSGASRADRADGGGVKGKAGRSGRPSWSSTHGRDLRFLLIFGVVIGLYYLATTTAFAKQTFFPWYLRLNAGLSVTMLNAVGYKSVSADGKAIRSPSFTIQIERGCDAVEPSALFVAAVLASPVMFRRKIPAIIIGTALLLALNLVRIITLYLTGLYLRSLFDMMHLDVWQAAFIVLAILFWAGWASWVGRTPVRQPDATA